MTNFDPMPAILLASFCIALVVVGVVRLINRLSHFSGSYRRLYDFYHQATGRFWLVDMDRDMSKDLDVQWQRYVREAQAAEVNLRG